MPSRRPGHVTPGMMTEEQREFVLSRYAETDGADLAEQFAERFGEVVLLADMSRLAHEAGVRKARGRGKNLNGINHGAVREFLLEYSADHTLRECSDELLRRYGVRRTTNALGIMLRRQAGRHVRVTCDRWGRPVEVPFNSLPLLSVRERAGRPYVKVAWFAERRKNDQWVPLNHLAWERANGPLPDGWRVIPADGDFWNEDPDNLVACSKATHSALKKAYGTGPYGSGERLRSLVALCDLVTSANAVEDRLDPTARRKRYSADFRARRRAADGRD